MCVYSARSADQGSERAVARSEPPFWFWSPRAPSVSVFSGVNFLGIENQTSDLDQVYSAVNIPFSDWMSVLLEIEIPCILLFLNRNRISQNSPKRMHPKIRVSDKRQTAEVTKWPWFLLICRWPFLSKGKQFRVSHKHKNYSATFSYTYYWGNVNASLPWAHLQHGGFPVHERDFFFLNFS